MLKKNLLLSISFLSPIFWVRANEYLRISKLLSETVIQRNKNHGQKQMYKKTKQLTPSHLFSIEYYIFIGQKSNRIRYIHTDHDYKCFTAKVIGHC